jgi:hypothetical protein
MSQSSRTYCLVLHPDVPASLLQLFEAYIHEHRDMQWLFCSEPSFNNGFVSVSILKEKDSSGWVVQIPSDYVLAIADMSKDRPSLGFVSGNQE